MILRVVPFELNRCCLGHAYCRVIQGPRLCHRRGRGRRESVGLAPLPRQSVAVPICPAKPGAAGL